LVFQKHWLTLIEKEEQRKKGKEHREIQLISRTEKRTKTDIDL
jgi:hypothetical protein